MRDSFPIPSIRVSAQEKTGSYQAAGVVLTLVGVVLLFGGGLCYKYADTAIWRIKACPKCHRVYSRKNKRMRYYDMEKTMNDDKDFPQVSRICKACFTSLCKLRSKTVQQEPNKLRTMPLSPSDTLTNQC